MSDTIISVEQLGKLYRISHKQPGRERQSLRDAATEKFRSSFQKFFPRKSTVPSPAAAGESLPAEKTSRHEDFWALKDVSFDIKRGEVVGIIGRNGAGKSTLLKVLSRITEPTTGRIRIKGRVASLLEVGTGFHPELTGRENIFLNGAILGMYRAEIKKKFDEIVAFAEVDKFLDTPVKRYSSGMYVRLAFAVAAHLDPEILIIDEVLAVGDAQFQKKCLGKMGEVARGGRTVLFVSHTMTAIKSLTSRAILLDKGRISCNTTTDEAISKYLEMSSDASKAGLLAKNKGVHTDINSVRLLDAAGRDIDYYVPGTLFLIEIGFTTDGTHDMSIELFLTDSNQGRVAFASLFQLNGVCLPEKPGSYLCRLRLQPMWLASGSYHVDVATSRVNASWDQHIDRALSFNVPFSNPKGLSWDFKFSFGFGTLGWLADETPEIISLPQGGAEAVLAEMALTK